MQRTASYFRTPQIGGATPQETEILAFGLCNDRLARAATPRERIEALGKTQQLWSLLVNDLGMEGNGLPDELKQNLLRLGIWAMSYSTRAILQDLPLNPLIELHRDMIEGLRGQVHKPAQTPAEAWSGRAVTA